MRAAPGSPPMVAHLGYLTLNIALSAHRDRTERGSHSKGNGDEELIRSIIEK